VSPLDEAEAVVAELAALYADCRVRAQQIALSRLYWRAVRVRDALLALAAA
jgi:hypothetical protein